MLGDTLGDAHNQRHLGGDSFLNTGGGEWGPVDLRLVSAACLG